MSGGGGAVRLRGTEALTLEIGATLDASAARALVPERFELFRGDAGDGEAARASVLLFRMSGLAMIGLPGPAFDYCEALWRIAIVYEGAAAWFAVKCDIDHPVVRTLGAQLVKYPTRAARIVAAEARWRVEAEGGSIELLVRDEDDAPIPETRRIFASRGGGAKVYEIPWEEIPPTRARRAKVEVAADALARATFGEAARLDAHAVILRGRTHMCGFARRVR